MAENNDAERAALLPCPFCGNESVHVHDSYVDSSGFMVLCGNCTAEGPLCPTEKDASAEWNRRTPSASTGEDGLPELTALRAEVREWLCEGCRTVYPGPPAPGFLCVICPTCKGLTGPRGLMERRALERQVADLRAQLARQTQQQPVAWLEAEPSARGRPAHEVIFSVVYNSRVHTKCAPMTSNPVWPLYAAPPLSSEQQAEKGAG